jgi:hypothetical protein
MVYKDPEYSKKYYRNVLKEKMESRKGFCEVCGKHLFGWNVDKHHKQSKKHRLLLEEISTNSTEK